MVVMVAVWRDRTTAVRPSGKNLQTWTEDLIKILRIIWRMLSSGWYFEVFIPA